MKMAADRGCDCASRNKRRGAGRGKKSAPPASRPSRAPSLSLSPPTSGNWSNLVSWIMRSLRSRAADQVDFFGRSVLPQHPNPIRGAFSTPAAPSAFSWATCVRGEKGAPSGGARPDPFFSRFIPCTSCVGEFVKGPLEAVPAIHRAQLTRSQSGPLQRRPPNVRSDSELVPSGS